MEIRQITYFLAAAQTQNFHRAAEICLVAQPALSRQIAALENELGVLLFRRVKQRVVLTSEGLEFVHYARAALDQLQQGQQALARLQDGSHGNIQIGCIEPLTTAFLPTIFPSFHRLYPNIGLKVHVDRTDELLHLIENRGIDLGLIFHPGVQPEVLVVQELFRQPLQLLVAADHPLARADRAPITLEGVQRYPLYLLNESSRLRRAVDRLFTRQHLNLQPVIEIESVAGLKQLVKQSNGVTFMLQALLEPGEPGGKFALLPLADIHEEFIFALVYHRFGPIPLAARHFINAISDILAQNTATH
jgi:DNA-binding transcriptional LysR family regulator